MDHPYYDRYRQTETNRDKRLRVAKRRLDFALHRVEREFAAERRRLHLSLMVPSARLMAARHSG